MQVVPAPNPGAQEPSCPFSMCQGVPRAQLAGRAQGLAKDDEATGLPRNPRTRDSRVGASLWVPVALLASDAHYMGLSRVRDSCALHPLVCLATVAAGLVADGSPVSRCRAWSSQGRLTQAVTVPRASEGAIWLSLPLPASDLCLGKEGVSE